MPLWDYRRVEAHLLRLGPEDRYLRFNTPASDHAIRRFVRGLPLSRSLVFAFEVSGDIRAAAQLIWDRGLTPHSAELAITVEEAWRSQGIGTALVQRAVLFARNRRFSKVHMVCLQENIAMRRLAAVAAGQLSYDEGEVAADVHLAPPDQLSVFQEAMEASSGAVIGALSLARSSV